MSKAFQCDKCGECFPGSPTFIHENGSELCYDCLRVLRYLGVIDLMDYKEKDIANKIMNEVLTIVNNTSAY